MSEDLGKFQDQGDVAWGRVLGTHKNKPQFEAFVKSLYPSVTLLDVSLADLFSKRWVDSAQGQQLDYIGSIVGVGRDIPEGMYLKFFGFEDQLAGVGFGKARIRFEYEPYAEVFKAGDSEYRLMIKAKIASNNGHGTAEEIIKVAQEVAGARDVIISETPPRAYTVKIFPGDEISIALEKVLLSLLPRPGGIKATVTVGPPSVTLMSAGGPIQEGYNTSDLGSGATLYRWPLQDWMNPRRGTLIVTSKDKSSYQAGNYRIAVVDASDGGSVSLRTNLPPAASSKTGVYVRSPTAALVDRQDLSVDRANSRVHVVSWGRNSILHAINGVLVGGVWPITDRGGFTYNSISLYQELYASIQSVVYLPYRVGPDEVAALSAVA